MLRITTLNGHASSRILKLEGKLLAPWVEEVRLACGKRPISQLSLDLTDLAFADAAGAHLLHELLRNGVTIRACSSFVEALLQRDTP